MKAQVTLYTRAGCCLCDQAKAALLEARGKAEFDFREIDIDPDPELTRLYGHDIPVIAIDGVEAFRHRVAVSEFLKKLELRK